jgi:hypothetical protein
MQRAAPSGLGRLKASQRLLYPLIGAAGAFLTTSSLAIRLGGSGCPDRATMADNQQRTAGHSLTHAEHRWQGFHGDPDRRFVRSSPSSKVAHPGIGSARSGCERTAARTSSLPPATAAMSGGWTLIQLRALQLDPGPRGGHEHGSREESQQTVLTPSPDHTQQVTGLAPDRGVTPRPYVMTLGRRDA